MPVRTRISTKQFGTDSDGNGVIIYPYTDTEAVKSTKETVTYTDTDGTQKTRAKTLQEILEELEAASGSITVDESLDKTSSNPVQNKTLANILTFT